MLATGMKLTWEKSPFLGRLKLEKSTRGTLYISIFTSVVGMVVLLFELYCLKGKEIVKLLQSFL